MVSPVNSDCIFCKIVAGEIPCFKVYEDENSLAFMDINPVTPGHTLVIPKAHYENIYTMPPEIITEVHQASQKVAGAIQNSLQNKGLSVVQHNGRDAGQLIMHYHVHLIPRDREVDSLATFEWEMVPGDMDLIAKQAEQIKAAI